MVTASNRAAAGVYSDRGGPVLVEGLRALGFDVDGPVVVADGDPVEAELRRAVSARYDVVLTTGGTGLSPTDRTPEVTARVLERAVPGLVEAIRAYGVSRGTPTAALSRGLAGVAGETLVVNLPGSPGGCRDGMAVLVRRPAARRRPDPRRRPPTGWRDGRRSWWLTRTTAAPGRSSCATAASCCARCAAGTPAAGGPCATRTWTGWRRGRPPTRARSGRPPSGRWSARSPARLAPAGCCRSRSS